MSAFVAYCDKYYYELSDSSRIKNINIDEIAQDIKERSTLSDNEIFNKQSIYEILMFDTSFPASGKNIQTASRYINRLFLDIEKLPYGMSSEYLNKIINDFIKYIKSNLTLYKYNIDNDKANIDIHIKVSNDEINFNYVITHNISSSSHYGDSYHVIFSNIYIYHTAQTKSILTDFINKHIEYIEYIDTTIYTTRRLFRLPYCRNIAPGPRKTINKNDIHKIETKAEDLRDFIIQYKQIIGNIIILDRFDPINFVKRIKSKDAPNGGFSGGGINKQCMKAMDKTKYINGVNKVVDTIEQTDKDLYNKSAVQIEPAKPIEQTPIINQQLLMNEAINEIKNKLDENNNIINELKRTIEEQQQTIRRQQEMIEKQQERIMTLLHS